MNVGSLSIKPNLTNHLQLKIIFDIVLRVTFCSWQWHYRTGFQSVLNNVQVSICTYIKTSYACCDHNHSFLLSHVPGTSNVSDRGQNPQPCKNYIQKFGLIFFFFPLCSFSDWAAQQGKDFYFERYSLGFSNSDCRSLILDKLRTEHLCTKWTSVDFVILRTKKRRSGIILKISL